MNENKYDVIIIGGGPAGLTAAIYTSRANLKTLILAGSPAGGQLMWTTDVENFPGFPAGIMGPDLISLMQQQSIKFGAEYVEENVEKVFGNSHTTFSVTSGLGKVYEGKSIIIATGASAKWLPLENVQKLRGKGVSACATCDGFFFKSKVVAVVGAGDAAMEEANYLTKFATKVYVLARGSKDSLKASKIMQKRAQENEKIEFVFNTEVIDVLGENSVEGIKVKNSVSGEEKVMDDVKGLFMAIGHKPNTDFLAGLIELGPMDYIVPVDNTKTTVEGIFVAGDVGDWKYRQAISAAGFGCIAALDVEKYLANKE
jgi:thioredoxin reductase (NADPH)